MKCERLIKLIKNWYVQVQDEAMAPARMVDFMRAHLADCQVCKADPIVDLEVKKIIEIILPPTKVPKAVRKDEAGGDDFEEFEETGDDTGEEDGVSDDEDGEEVSDDLEDEELDDPDDDDI